MTMHPNWKRAERYARCGELGGYQNKSGKVFEWKQGMPKLTQAQQAEVVADYVNTTMTVAQIGRKHGVTPDYVSTLAKRRGAPMRQTVEMRERKSAAAKNAKRKTLKARRMKRLTKLMEQARP